MAAQHIKNPAGAFDSAGADRGEVERRAVTEWRVAGRRLVGYAAVFDQQADIGTFREIVRRGAFAESLRSKGDVLALVDHNWTLLLGRTKNGSLRLAEDARGLGFEVDLPSTTLGNDILALAERGDLGGASIGFLVPKDGERWEGRTRELVKVDLREVSVVQSWPAYEATTVAARARGPGRPGDRTRLRLAKLRADHL